MGINTSGLAQTGVAHGVSTDGHFGKIPLVRLEALGVTWNEPTVAFVDMNPVSKIHGLLGLDFFRGRILTVEFRGTVALNRPWRWSIRR